MIVGFVGAQLALDPEYTRQLSVCWTAMIAKYNASHSRLDNVPGSGDPINEDIIARLPAYARQERYRQALQAISLSRMAKVLLPVGECARSCRVAARLDPGCGAGLRQALSEQTVVRRGVSVKRK